MSFGCDNAGSLTPLRRFRGHDRRPVYRNGVWVTDDQRWSFFSDSPGWSVMPMCLSPTFEQDYKWLLGLGLTEPHFLRLRDALHALEAALAMGPTLPSVQSPAH